MLEGIGKRYMRMKQVRHEEQGFTLIELLVVIIIMGILAAIALPIFLDQREQAFIAECRSDTRNAAAAATSLYADFTDYTGMNVGGAPATHDLAANYGFNQSAGTVTSVTAADADSFTLSTDCQNVAGNVTFDSDVGQVTGP